MIGKIMKNENKNIIQSVIWFNLLIGIYYLYLFGTNDSIFHLTIGSMNIGVWVFFKDSITSIATNKNRK